MTKRILIAAFASLPAAVPASAAEVKSGLWEVRPIVHEVDGKDTLAAAEATREKLAAMADKLSAGGRERMPGTTSLRICVTPEAAARGLTSTETLQGRDPPKTTRSGDKMSFEFKCVIKDRATIGKGESALSPEAVHARVEMTTTGPKGVTVARSEADLKWLKFDCGDVKPRRSRGK